MSDIPTHAEPDTDPRGSDSASERDAMADLLTHTEAEIRASEQRLREIETEIARLVDAAIGLRIAREDAPDGAVRARAEADLADNQRRIAMLEREQTGLRRRLETLTRQAGELRRSLAALD